MISPFLQDDAFLADVSAPLRSQGECHLWWLGQSGYLVRDRAGYLLIDPYLSDSLTVKYAATDKPHVRMSRRVIPPARLAAFPQLYLVTASHLHTDHLDPDTLQPLFAAGCAAELLAPRSVQKLAHERSGLSTERIIGIDAGEAIQRGGAEIIALPAAHEAIDKDAAGNHLYLGFIIRLPCGVVLYHSGDTVLYEGMTERLRPFNIDVALLPINGRAPERRVGGNLNGIEAARLAKEIGAKLVIPCHYDMFEFNTASPEEFAAECIRIGQPHRVLRLGERWSNDERSE
jgi:L-ascorbate metabolism protein UlaG (beta-lactamase superfamily)